MHPADIHAALKKRGKTQVAIARDMNVTHGAVQMVMRGATKSARIASRIAAVTGIPVSTLWPGKYPELEHSEAIARARADLAAAGAREAAPRRRAQPAGRKAA